MAASTPHAMVKAMTKHLRPLTLLATTIALLAAPAPASAHTITPTTCRTVAAIWPTPTTRRAIARTCIILARRHTTAHIAASCIALPTPMTTGTCRALASVAPPWATDRAMHELIRRESGFDPGAVNDSSGACGLFQRLPCPWPHGSTHGVNASTLVQVVNGVRYVRGRYGSPSAALAHHNAVGWY
jgi:hypothetical protein